MSEPDLSARQLGVLRIVGESDGTAEAEATSLGAFHADWSLKVGLKRTRVGANLRVSR